MADDSKTFAVILDYCGGGRTDRLYEKIAADNPGRAIHLLDNASPRLRSKHATHRNEVNTYIGGGIRDCVALAERRGCAFLFFVVNDIKALDALRIADFEELMGRDDDVVQVSAALTGGSDKVQFAPHMTSRGTAARIVPHANLLACLLRLDFIAGFGGFPESKSGWGYDLDIAYRAARLGKKIVVSDRCRIEHANTVRTMRLESGLVLDKAAEMESVYRRRFAGEYADFESFYRALPQRG